MTIYKVALYAVLLFGLKIYAQTSDLQFIVETNDGTNYIVKIQIKGSSNFNLGTSNITFNYNSSDLGSPSLSQAYNFNTGSYTLNVTKPLVGVASINIVYSGLTGNGVEVGTSFMDVASISFPTDDPTGFSNLSFRTVAPNKTGIFKDDNSTLVPEGTWSPENTQPLPVELISFTASANNNVVNLSWQTATEVNNYGFEVERSPSQPSQREGVSDSPFGGKEGDWTKIGFVKGAGNSNSPKNYTFTDKNLTGGAIFNYRLKQIDTDGQFEYSEEVEVQISIDNYALLQNYPNPFNPATNIKFEIPQEAKVTLNIYNILGENVATLINETLEAGFHSILFDASRFPSGTYIYRLQAGNFVQTKKMILLK